MWKLSKDENNKRLYVNSRTNSQCSQTMVYVDKDGNKWWEFDVMTALPFTRTFAAQKITALYALNLSIDDWNAFLAKHKATLKAKDNGEKFEIAYAETLDMENKVKSATDPLKQMSALVPVYFTLNDEEIDSFETYLQLKKMLLLEADPKMHNFFLNDRIDHTERYMSFLNSIFQTASVQLPEILAPLP